MLGKVQETGSEERNESSLENSVDRQRRDVVPSVVIQLDGALGRGLDRDGALAREGEVVHLLVLALGDRAGWELNGLLRLDHGDLERAVGAANGAGDLERDDVVDFHVHGDVGLAVEVLGVVGVDCDRVRVAPLEVAVVGAVLILVRATAVERDGTASTGHHAVDRARHRDIGDGVAGEEGEDEAGEHHGCVRAYKECGFLARNWIECRFLLRPPPTRARRLLLRKIPGRIPGSDSRKSLVWYRRSCPAWAPYCQAMSAGAASGRRRVSNTADTDYSLAAVNLTETKMSRGKRMVRALCTPFGALLGQRDLPERLLTHTRSRTVENTASAAESSVHTTMVGVRRSRKEQNQEYWYVLRARQTCGAPD